MPFPRIHQNIANRLTSQDRWAKLLNGSCTWMSNKAPPSEIHSCELWIVVTLISSWKAPWPHHSLKMLSNKSKLKARLTQSCVENSHEDPLYASSIVGHIISILLFIYCTNLISSWYCMHWNTVYHNHNLLQNLVEQRVPWSGFSLAFQPRADRLRSNPRGQAWALKLASMSGIHFGSPRGLAGLQKHRRKGHETNL